jgi:hypothetical protein
MKKRLIALTFGLSCLGGTSLWAHHSLAAEFDQKKPISLSGTLYMDVKNSSGGIDKWECELGSPNAMTRAGFTQDSVKLGDEIVLDGILAKKGTNICSTRTVKAKDGRTVLSQTEGAR